MQNLKIRVNSADESKEAQELFFELGYEWHGSGKSVSYLESVASDEFGYLVAWKPGCFSKYIIQMGCGKEDAKEITLPELRAMVNPMKEYLNENCNYEFVLSNKKYDGFIEIPEGAIRARFYPHDPDELEFENSTFQWWHDKDNEWINYENYSNTLKHSRVVWQRDQDEPFLTPECTLNDQYAEIEQVRQAINKSWGSVGAAQASGGVDATLTERQSQYGCYEDVAHVTQEILKALRISGYDRMPATHKESMHMIASKMARLVCGDCNSIDGWHDISGYATLVERLIGDQSDV